MVMHGYNNHVFGAYNQSVISNLYGIDVPLYDGYTVVDLEVRPI